MTQLSEVSIDWSSHSRSMLRRTSAMLAPICDVSARSGPIVVRVSESSVR